MGIRILRMVCLVWLVLPIFGQADEQSGDITAGDIIADDIIADDIIDGSQYGVLIEPLPGEMEAICAINMYPEGAQWFWLHTPGSGMNQVLGPQETAFLLVSSLKASPDGRYLAVLSVGEGHPMIEVIDLPQLLNQKQYRVLHAVNPYPGVVSIERWDGQELQLASDMLLTHRDPVTGDVPEKFLLADSETFALNATTGAIRGISEGAISPAKHYVRVLMDRLASEHTKNLALTGLLNLEPHQLNIGDLFNVLEQEENSERIIKLMDLIKHIRQQSSSQE